MSLIESVTGSPALSGIVFLFGVAVVLVSVEAFVENVAEAAVGLGVSTFLLTVVLAGTDVENAILGVAAVAGGLPGVGLGTVYGEALFVLCAALGLGGLVVPFAIETPRQYLALAAVAPALLFALSVDGRLTRLDGVALVAAFLPLVWLIYRRERRRDVRYLEPEADVAAELGAGAGGDDRDDQPDWDEEGRGVVDGGPAVEGPAGGPAAGDGESTEEALDARETLIRVAVVLLAVAGMTVGSELAVVGTRGLLAFTGIEGLAFGATVMSFVASIEEVFLTVEPVRNGRPEVATGNVIGSTLFFVTANAGLLALVGPIPTGPGVFAVQWPLFGLALAVVLALLYRGRVGRASGAVLLGIYAAYWVANYL